MKYEIQTACEQGAVRSNNEDAIAYGEVPTLGIFWMLIADGMGGHNAGEVASKMLIDTIEEAFSKINAAPKQGWQDWMSQNMQAASLAIYQAAQENSSYRTMGTTGVLVIIENQQSYIAWAGDSRAYRQSGDQLFQLTRDHSMIQYLLDKGAITEKEAQESNTKNILSRAIGVKDEIEIETKSEKLKVGDTIMLSTDGLHDYLTQKEILDYLHIDTIKESRLDDMVSQAIKQESKDNVTIGVIKLAE